MRRPTEWLRAGQTSGDEVMVTADLRLGVLADRYGAHIILVMQLLELEVCSCLSRILAT